MVNGPQQQIALIRDFVNTVELPGGPDKLATRAQCGAWLCDRGLLAHGTRNTIREQGQAVDVREALRTLLLANNEVRVDTAGAVATLDEAARRANLGVRFGADGATVEPGASGVTGAIGRVLASVAELMGTEEWSRLKACRRHDCLWAFYDGARNRSRAWCSMETCGNREKARLYRERHR